jgi:two-component system chemotaxis response regulator CheY
MGDSRMKLRALVIDDSRVMRSLIMQSLRRTELADFDFTEAEDGADALAKFHAKRPDILFVDWNMPKLSGIDFVRRVRALESARHIPIIMVTSEKTIGKVEEALDQAGADEYITKPFLMDDLKRTLARLIDSLAAAKAEQSAAKSPGFFSKLVGGSGSVGR